MRNLTFISLAIASPSQRSANRFEFHPVFNLITGADNSIGKSTLVKLLLWSLGCDPVLDVAWASTETRCILEFTLDSKTFTVGRSGDTIVFQEGSGPRETYTKISGNYAKRLATLIGFDVLLPNRKDATRLEVPPPAYYFLPFYVDQRRGWSAAWNGFEALEQYANWQTPVISYHTGYLIPEHFQFASQIAAEASAANVEQKNIDRISGAIAVVEELAPAIKSPSAGERVDDLIADIGENISEHQRQLDQSLKQLTEVREELAQLLAQREMLTSAAHELGLDYTFAVENTSGDRLLCPVCGTVHNNTLAERAGLLAEKAAAEGDLNTILQKEARLKIRAERIEKRTHLLRQKIDSYSEKFETADDAGADKGDFLTRLSSAAIQKMATRTRAEAEVRVVHRKSEGNRLKKAQRKLLSKEERLALDESFRTLLTTYVDQLGATGVNLFGVDAPTNHKRLFGSGGAAESTRAALAYYLSIHSMIKRADNEALAPLIVDTPNQHEQTDFNYESALRAIAAKTSSSQVFVCAMDKEAVQPYKERGKVTWLDGAKLLDQAKYPEMWPMIEQFFAQDATPSGS